MRFRLARLLRVSDGLVDKAVNAYTDLFHISGDGEADLYVQIGKDLARQDKLAEAQAALRRGLELRPDDVDAWTELGLTHLHQDAPAAAVECFERAEALSGSSLSFELHFHYAQALGDLGLETEAVEQFAKALEAQPDSHEALYQMSILLDGLGRLEEAVTALEKAIELAPKIGPYHQVLGFVLESMGRRDEAIACFKRALHLERRASISR